MLLRGQTEGITWTSAYKGYFSGEAISSSTFGINNPAKLHAFNLQGYIPFLPTAMPLGKISSFEVYPNPAQNILFITGEIKNNLPYWISDVEGNCVLQGNLNSNYINIEDLPAGQYFLNLNNTTQVQFVKLKQ